MDALTTDDPTEIGPYSLLARIGEGGMGRVYLAESPQHGHIAIKLIAALNEDGPDETAQFRRRFRREIEIARSVDGPSIALYVDADADADPPWLATEFVPGPDLTEHVRNFGPLHASCVAALGSHLADGLAAIHESGLTHRDFKPNNVMLGQEGPRIIDFGLAVLVGQWGDPRGHLTTLGNIPGTWSWMSPEQRAGDPINAATDVYSLGLTLLYAATGKPPQQLRSSQVPEPLSTVLADMLHRTVSTRPKARDACARLSAVAAGDATTAAHATSELIAATYGRHSSAVIPPPPPVLPGMEDRDDLVPPVDVVDLADGANLAASNIRAAYAKAKELLLP